MSTKTTDDINYCVSENDVKFQGNPIGPIPIIGVHDLLIYIALVLFCLFIIYIVIYYIIYTPKDFPWKAFGILFLFGNVLALLCYIGLLLWEYKCDGVVRSIVLLGSQDSVKKGEKVVRGEKLGYVIIPLIGVVLFFLVLCYNILLKKNYLFRQQDTFPWISVAMNLISIVLLLIYMLITYLYKSKRKH